jgi:hypothetical protein
MKYGGDRIGGDKKNEILKWVKTYRFDSLVIGLCTHHLPNHLPAPKLMIYTYIIQSKKNIIDS